MDTRIYIQAHTSPKMSSKPDPETTFFNYCSDLADGELYIFKKDADFFCFDVNEAYTFRKLRCESGVEGEWTAELTPDTFPDYSVCVFYYPDKPRSHSWLQLFHMEKDIGSITGATFTVSRVKKPFIK